MLRTRVKPKVLQCLHVAWRHNVMRLINEHELEIPGIEFVQAISGYDAPHRCNGYVGSSRSVDIAHLNLNGFGRVRVETVPGRLLHELSAVGENESLSGVIVWWLDPINELCENDLCCVTEIALVVLHSRTDGLAATGSK